jgi:ppGpp synthetase/RelA/SpoT-type nucleotidyltranferase
MTEPMADAPPEREDVEKVLADFDARRDMLEAFCNKTRSLIEDALDYEGIRYQSVQARVKTKKKLKKKYGDPTKGYRKLDDITDLAGLRVITYYEDEVDQVAEIIKREFKIDPERSVDKRKTEPDRFGYHALNYICCHAKERSERVEYRRYAGVWCEIQITSILRHAWSEIEHEWYDLKEAYPDEIKRRFYRLAGVFELAESEFLDLKKKRSAYQKSMDVQVEAKVADVPLDAVSIKSLISQDEVVAELDRTVSERLGGTLSPDLDDRLVEVIARAASIAGMSTIDQVRTALRQYKIAIIEYVGRNEEDPVTRRRKDPGAAQARGTSIFQLALMLIGERNDESLLDAIEKVYGRKLSGETARVLNARAANAKAVLSRHMPPTDTQR